MSRRHRALRALTGLQGLALVGAAVGLTLLAAPAAGQDRSGAAAPEARSDLPVLLVPHASSAKSFPCSKCHRHLVPNREKRALELAHTGIRLRHAEEQRWCHNCHEGDRLRLPNGELVDYERSFVLCGQCHGTVFRDWKVGIHGKRTGAWNGERYYRLCVSCHDAHEPAFKPIEPRPAPVRPADLGRGARR